MPERLVELYSAGDRVEIAFGGEEWIAAEVVRLAHPGIWVLTQEGGLWFVTNGRHIRRLPPSSAGTVPSDE